MSQPKITDVRHLQALRLIESCGSSRNAGLTEYGCSPVSRAAPDLIESGMILFAPERDVAYAVTAEGRKALGTVTVRKAP